jgi:hypothetical protein
MGPLLKNLDAYCARLNAGLTAVAVVLSVLVAAELTVRLPDFFAQAVQVEATEAFASGASTGF